ncbi:hypothetical protein QE152_g40055 [Popillia japonica]|uniref:Uncharacterized protein n=1 Tax=Popillia japonica TaxID=7064 RepID=A0AAW1HSI1_POPJA
MKEHSPESLSFCFDLQQVHPLPKTPIQDACYLRQISSSTFCCMDITSKKPFFYTWVENQAHRVSTEIESALLMHLRLLDNIRNLRLFCDGCAEHNKNPHIVHILAFWLRTESPDNLTDLTLHFPVREHSYLPADRDFGHAEKELKKRNILSPETNRLGLNIKKLSDTNTKIPGIKDMKRTFLRKFSSTNGTMTVKYKESAFLKYDDDHHYVCIVKKDSDEQKCQLSNKALGVQISDEKKKNVKTLLEKQFNHDNIEWQNLPYVSFYKEILFGEGSHLEIGEELTHQHEEDGCDCLEDDFAMYI